MSADAIYLLQTDINRLVTSQLIDIRETLNTTTDTSEFVS